MATVTFRPSKLGGTGKSGRLCRPGLGRVAVRLLQNEDPTLHDESRAAARSQRVYPSQSPSTELLMQVVQFIMSHLDGDLSVAALARRFSSKDRVLLTAFESHTGIALGQFVLRRRLERALDFLKNTNASDSEIAIALGWGSASAFRTAFV